MFRGLGKAVGFVLLAVALTSAQVIQPDPVPVQSATVVQSQSSYRPISASQCFDWFLDNTVRPRSLSVGLFTAGLGTARNVPREYGTHWAGFGKRYGMRLTGISTGNAMEAGLGALWGEDPRYVRAPDAVFKARLANVMILTLLAHNRAGMRMPAYSRYLAIPGSNFLSNTWRADSEANNRDAAIRTVWGFLGQMGQNAFLEFWPDVQRKVFHRGR